MSNQLTPQDLEKISSLAYLDIIGENKKTALAKLYGDKDRGYVTLGEVIDYYQTDTQGKKWMAKRFKGTIDGESELELWNDFLDEMNTDTYRDWKISNVVSTNEAHESGFVACTIEVAPGVKVAAFRGSEPLGDATYRNDWRDDAMFSYSKGTPQQLQAVAYMKSFEKDNTLDNLYMTGHSLGGNLDLYGLMSLPKSLQNRLMTCTTFAAPGQNSAVIKDHTHRGRFFLRIVEAC